MATGRQGIIYMARGPQKGGETLMRMAKIVSDLYVLEKCLNLSTWLC